MWIRWSSWGLDWGLGESDSSNRVPDGFADKLRTIGIFAFGDGIQRDDHVSGKDD